MRRLWLAGGLTALLAWVAFSYQAPATHPVTGRKIAGVMGVAGADWLVRPERETEEHPDQALDELKLKPGMVIADIGAGIGYFSLKFAQRVAPSGKVYAVDLQPGMLSRLRVRAAAQKITNVETILGAAADPKLPAGEIDLVFLCDVYHEFSQPQAMIRKIREALKPDGRLVLLEYRGEDPAIPIKEDHKMTVDQVRREIEPEGFKLQKPIESLPIQHLLILTKTE